MLGEDIVFLGECGLHRFRSSSHCGTRIRSNNLYQRRVQHVVHREEDRFQRLLAVFLLNQVVDVRNSDLGWEAWINRATARARAVELGTGVVGVNDVLRLHAEALEIGVE